jgi:hypothetical protein
VYEENYPAGERGARFARTTMIRIASAAAFSWIGGIVLSGGPGRFPWLLAAYAAALGFAGFCLARIPSTPLTRIGGSHPFRAARYVREDRLFRVTLVSWMLMGFGNLMMLPLRVDYLADPRHGLAYSAATVALLTGVIPNLARFALSAAWGRLFDRMDFFALRAAINAGFAVGIVAFFLGDSLPWLVAASLVFGISNAGGDIAWSLWVTKLAPPGRVADYMSVHAFLNGLRSAIAPFLAFALVERYPVSALAWACAALILAASLLLVPEFSWVRARRRGTSGAGGRPGSRGR